MGREVRKVPADWQHPTRDNGDYIPLMGGSFSKAAAEWDEGERQWNLGFREKTVWHDGGGYHKEWVPKDDEHTYPYSDWAGSRPEESDYMPDWPDSERTHLQMYEDTSEGTPISPVMDTPEELARWLADTGASAFGSMNATYEQWLATIKRGFACSAVLVNGVMDSGVAGLASTDKATPSDAQLKSGATRSDERPAESDVASLTQEIESLRASLANAESRAEEAEGRATFFETEMTRILQEGAKR